MNFKRSQVPSADRPPAETHPGVRAVEAKLQRPLAAKEIALAKRFPASRFGAAE